ncbi:MAG: hypothetical protein JW963_05830 [Anaerolineales bacterium]|nr:hypothetical protein [Anaerolineales bacterium]
MIPVPATFVIQADLRHCVVVMENRASDPDSIRPADFSRSVPPQTLIRVFVIGQQQSV